MDRVTENINERERGREDEETARERKQGVKDMMTENRGGGGSA